MQKDSANDLELNLKKRARRRLVGAIALVLLMFITLPFLLKDRAATQPQEQITITLPGEQAITLPAVKPSDFDSSVVPSAPVATTPEPAETPAVAATVVDEAPIVDSEAAPTIPKETPKEPKPKEPAPKAESKPVAKPDSPKQVESKPSPEKAPPAKETAVKEAVKPKPDASHKFYVQVGVFSDEANVKQLQGKLSDLGYKSQTEKIDTPKGKKIRLRTQVFADRNEAAIALQNIKDAGLVGMVVSQ
jgi:DedD protein